MKESEGKMMTTFDSWHVLHGLYLTGADVDKGVGALAAVALSLVDALAENDVNIVMILRDQHGDGDVLFAGAWGSLEGSQADNVLLLCGEQSKCDPETLANLRAMISTSLVFFEEFEAMTRIKEGFAVVRPGTENLLPKIINDETRDAAKGLIPGFPLSRSRRR